MTNKLKVGQSVFYVDNSNRLLKTGLTTVTKVGRDYFEVDAFNRERFFIKTMRHDSKYGSPRIVIFHSEQEYLDIKRHQGLRAKFREVFGWNSTAKLTLEQLEAINTIIEGSNND
jgi:hypothetical protein